MRVVNARRTNHASRSAAREQRAAVADPGPVLEAAARFLEARPRSVAETRRRLLDAGYPPSLVETALARLQDLGYLDDAAFARAWVESRDRAHPRGEAALKRELARKGVSDELIAAVLVARTAPRGEPGQLRPSASSPRAARDDDADAAAARRLLQRRTRALLRELDPRKRRQKAYALLARQGFDPETCRTVVSAWSEAAEAVTDADPAV